MPLVLAIAGFFYVFPFFTFFASLPLVVFLSNKLKKMKHIFGRNPGGNLKLYILLVIKKNITTCFILLCAIKTMQI